jgi:hypothetical protein
MCGYLAFYKDKKVEIHADGLYAAKMKAIEHFKVPPKKTHMVHVELCEVEGREVIHSC